MNELLKPRYEVIADYPGNIQQIGYVFHSDIGDYYNKFPAIFRKLSWWEHRKPEEMPEYVKEIESIGDGYSITYIYKNKKDFKYLTSTNCIGMRLESDKRMIHLQYLEPATEAEYTQYINNSKV